MMKVALIIYLFATLLASIEACHLENTYKRKLGDFPSIHYRIALNLLIMVPVLNFQYAWSAIKRAFMMSCIYLLRFLKFLG